MARRENPNATNNNPSNAINIGGIQTMVDLLESGILEKVRYIPNSMNLDAVLAPYVETGQVVMMEDDDFPEYVMMPYQFHWKSAISDNNWRTDVTYPATDVPVPGELIDAMNVYKAVLIRRSASICFFLPIEYRIDAERYRYFKLKLFTTSPDAAFAPNNYNWYKTLWTRFMNFTWWGGTGNDIGNGAWGQEVWHHGNPRDNPSVASQFTIPEANLRTRWTEFTFDMHHVDGANRGALTRHSKFLQINFGQEINPGHDVLDTANPIVMYFADVRFTKTP
jgi:hypothetical protein